MMLHKMGWPFQKVLYPSLTWRKATHEKTIYLTFDDGPIPGPTEWVLETLANFSAKATFFCVGDNVGKYPEIYKKLVSEGHTTGNHTFNHFNGWKTETDNYLENVALGKEVMTAMHPEKQAPRLYRPPYGRITPKQIVALQPIYEIVMWEVLSGDFSASLAKETCLQKSVRYTRTGSIIVFHDSHKAFPNLEYTLPRYLEYFAKKGYRFEALG